MDDRLSIESIDYTTFQHVLARYPRIVPAELAALDKERLETIPAAMNERRPQPFFTKDELMKLMQWKLAHGKFRPSLQKLVDANDVMSVKTTAIEALRLYPDATTKAPTTDDMKVLVESISRLRGVGPATATLILNCYDQTNVPFFSDELYRWVRWRAPPTPQSGVRPPPRGLPVAGTWGWAREIRYTVGDYLEIYPKVLELRRRLSEESGQVVRALDVEMVAYVLGTEAKPPPPPPKKKSSEGVSSGKKRKASAKDREGLEVKKGAKRGKTGNSVGGLGDGGMTDLRPYDRATSNDAGALSNGTSSITVDASAGSSANMESETKPEQPGKSNSVTDGPIDDAEMSGKKRKTSTKASTQSDAVPRDSINTQQQEDATSTVSRPDEPEHTSSTLHPELAPEIPAAQPSGPTGLH